jgi:hypothetical protein
MSPSTHAERVLTGAALTGLLAVASAPAAVTTTEVVSVPAKAFAGARHARTIDVPKATGAIELRARRRCGSGATLKVTVDRHIVILRRVTAKRLRTLHVTHAVPAGRRRLAVTVDGGRSPHCRRPLAFGALRLIPTAQTTGQSERDSPPGPPSGGTPPAGAPASTGTGTSSSGGAPATTPAPTAPARPKLAWAPPALTAPTTIDVGAGDQTYVLDTTKDYILKLGAATHAGGLGIKGGRNVVVIGGRIALPRTSARTTALGIVDATGTVHVEGVWIDAGSGKEFDAIQISAPKATVQLENIRATGLRGSYTTNHTDIVQPWGGVARLRIDRLTGTTNYQGIFNQPDQGPIGPVDIRHTDLIYDNAGAQTGGYLLWLTNGCTAAPTTLTEVYVKGRSGSTLGSTVWPPTGGATACPATISGLLATWPELSIAGAARWGAPPAGPFVKAGAAGAGYGSPGYG